MTDLREITGDLWEYHGRGAIVAITTGGLQWHDVAPLLSAVFDRRFLISQVFRVTRFDAEAHIDAYFICKNLSVREKTTPATA